MPTCNTTFTLVQVLTDMNTSKRGEPSKEFFRVSITVLLYKCVIEGCQPKSLPTLLIPPTLHRGGEKKKHLF